MVHEVTTLDGVPAIVADFIDGVTLRDFLQVRRLTFRESAALVAEVADALDYAHAMGLVHRDVKPANIMIETSPGPGPGSGARTAAGAELVSSADAATRLRPLLLDFGLALRGESEVTMTVDGQVVGTPAYMSPEQAAGHGHRVDRRSDVYALGVVLYELLCGELPFRGTMGVLRLQVLQEEPRPPRRLNSQIPRDLETICLKAMAKEPARRYPTARDLSDDLRRFLQGEPIQARPVGALEWAWRWIRHRPATAALAAVSVVAALALAGVVVGLLYNRELRLAHERTQDALQAESEARKQAEMYQYFHHVSRAHAEWRDGSMGRVEPLLLDCPPGHRGWEWHYLHRLCSADLLTLRGRSGGLLAVALSPDGTRVASGGSADVQLWDLRTGQVIRTFEPRSGIVRGVALSPDGSRLAAGCGDHTVKVWEVATGQLLGTLREHADVVRGVAFSPDGSRLASASVDRTVRIWDASTGHLLRTLPGEDEFYQVAFSPDGTQVAAGGADRTVRMWDASSGQQTRRLQGHTGTVTAVAFSPDGTRLASGGWDNTVKVWDPATEKTLFTLRGHTGYVRGVAFSPDGSRLASAGVDQAIRVWEAQTGREAFVLKGHRGEVAAVAFSPDGARLASAAPDGTVRLWAVTPRQEVHTLAGHGGAVRGVAFSPDGKRLASAGRDGSVKIWELSTGQELHRLSRALTMEAASRAIGVAFSPAGQRLALAGGRAVLLWDPASAAEPLALGGHTGTVLAVAFSPDGALIAAGGADGTVQVWEAATGRRAAVCQGHTAPVHCVAFSPDGQRLAAGGEDDTVWIWEVATGREMVQLRGPPVETVWSVAFSPDGKQLATGLWGNHARLWDAATGQPLFGRLNHNSDVYGVAFSPDGKRLVSASGDQTVKVWDTATGQEAVALRGHTGQVWAVAFSPDGFRLASASEDHTVNVWDATDLTEEVRAERDAVALLDFLFSRPLPKSEVRAAIRRDSIIAEAARRKALELTEHFNGETDPKKYHDAAWPVVRHPHANFFACRFALAQANEACAGAPDDAQYRIALGVARYRLGKFHKEHYAEARAALTRCDPNHPATLAFLAMTQYQLGEKEQTPTTLARLREIMKKPEWAAKAEIEAFAREAAGLIEGKAALPRP
jgi:WD40 repeat protein